MSQDNESGGEDPLIEKDEGDDNNKSRRRPWYVRQRGPLFVGVAALAIGIAGLVIATTTKDSHLDRIRDLEQNNAYLSSAVINGQNALQSTRSQLQSQIDANNQRDAAIAVDDANLRAQLATLNQQDATIQASIASIAASENTAIAQIREEVHAIADPRLSAELLVIRKANAFEATILAGSTDMPVYGGNAWNWRSNVKPSALNVDSLKASLATPGKRGLKSVYRYKDAANPLFYNGPFTTAGNIMYFPDWFGNLTAVDKNTKDIIWTRSILNEVILPIYNTLPLSDTQCVAGDYKAQFADLVSRTAPAVYGDYLYIGLLWQARVLKVNRFTGKDVWLTRADMHRAAVITSSFNFHDGKLFTGISSGEEITVDCFADNHNQTYVPTFRGSTVALSMQTGEIVWKKYIIPDVVGLAGGAVWGPNPPIDVRSNQVFFGTGNLYSVPASLEACLRATQNITTFSNPCRIPDDYSTSVVSFDMTTGDIRWFNPSGDADVWTAICWKQSGANYYRPAFCSIRDIGPDADYGQAPIFVPRAAAPVGYNRDIVIAAQKNGVVWTFDANTGLILHSYKVNRGGPQGGFLWGSSFDGKRFYGNSLNNNDPNAVGSTSTVIAYDPFSNVAVWTRQFDIGRITPVWSSNGIVVVAGIQGTSPRIFVLEAATGRVLMDENNFPFIDANDKFPYSATFLEDSMYLNFRYRAFKQVDQFGNIVAPSTSLGHGGFTRYVLDV